MVEYKDENIFNSQEQIITNTVNCMGVMGKGLALEFKKRYPEMFNDYRRRCENWDLERGEPYLFGTILNFPTKDDWRKPSDLTWIDRGLKWIVFNYKALRINSIALPKLGCGNGGLDWNDVKNLIEENLGNIPDLKVVVYTK